MKYPDTLLLLTLDTNVSRTRSVPHALPPLHYAPDENSLPAERVLLNGRAVAFDHGAHAFPVLHRRLRRRLCGASGGLGISTNEHSGRRRNRRRRRSNGRSSSNTGGLFSRGELKEKDESADAFSSSSDENDGNSDDDNGDVDGHGDVFHAHAWQEEAPQCQLNGGSDPVVVTATHVINHGRGWASVRGGSAGRRGAMLRIRTYNATNAKLLGFVIRLSFGQGAEALGMGDGGRVETSVDEVCCAFLVRCLTVIIVGFRVDGEARRSCSE